MLTYKYIFICNILRYPVNICICFLFLNVERNIVVFVDPQRSLRGGWDILIKPSSRQPLTCPARCRTC